ncbi:hypothetical protein LSAT2_013251 [Lamellibrachia satsuma]|nr:hypothetical protein LSAT2_013251 [Lamellibrachia satsuma]
MVVRQRSGIAATTLLTKMSCACRLSTTALSFHDVPHTLTDTDVTEGVGAQPVARNVSSRELTEGIPAKDDEEKRHLNARRHHVYQLVY